MCKLLYLTIFSLLFSIISHSQTVDSISSENYKTNKNKKYDAARYLDTLIVDKKEIITTKKNIIKYFRKYTKNSIDSVIYNGVTLTIKECRQLIVKNKRDSIRAHKNLWASVLGGPSYTPESSVGIGGAMLLTFKFKVNDTLLNRSTLPFGFLATVNKTFMLAGGSEFFLNKNRIQINTNYGVTYEPNNYFGVGFNDIDKNYKSDSTTQYRSLLVKFKPTILFKVTENIFIGPLIDYSYYKFDDINPVMSKDKNYTKYPNKYLVGGIGLNFRYDTRDNSTMPYKGTRLNFNSVVYGKWLGGVSNFTYTSIDYRGYKRLFNRRSVIAWTTRLDISTGDVPFTELPSFGSPTNLRGYAVGHYRDKTMGYAIAEYRHMFGSTAVYNYRRPLYSRLGVALWGGVGTIGAHVNKWNQAKWNYGIGLRYEIQPNTNFRLDIGKSPGGKAMVYMNMIEAF